MRRSRRRLDLSSAQEESGLLEPADRPSDVDGMLDSLVSFIGTAVFLLYVLPMLFVINFYVTGFIIANDHSVLLNMAMAFATARVLCLFNSVCAYICRNTRAAHHNGSPQRLGHHVLHMGLVGFILCQANLAAATDMDIEEANSSPASAAAAAASAAVNGGVGMLLAAAGATRQHMRFSAAPTKIPLVANSGEAHYARSGGALRWKKIATEFDTGEHRPHSCAAFEHAPSVMRLTGANCDAFRDGGALVPGEFGRKSDSTVHSAARQVHFRRER